MGFLGGTGFKSFVTGGAREYKALTSPKEMTDWDKKRLDFDADMFKTEYDKLINIDKEIVNFGDPTITQIKGPFGRFYPHTTYPINIRTGAADNKQDQIAVMMDYFQIPDSLYDLWTEEKQEEVTAYLTSAGQEYEDIMNNLLQ
jgi:hypothetical protein